MKKILLLYKSDLYKKRRRFSFYIHTPSDVERNVLHMRYLSSIQQKWPWRSKFMMVNSFLREPTSVYLQRPKLV